MTARSPLTFHEINFKIYPSFFFSISLIEAQVGLNKCEGFCLPAKQSIRNVKFLYFLKYSASFFIVFLYNKEKLQSVGVLIPY